MVSKPETYRLSFKVNGKSIEREVDTRTSLLDFLRTELGLTGTKKGCDRGQCGACTVIIDGQRHYSCLRLAVTVNDQEVTTIEGIGSNGKLHPMQQAFVDHDAMQCGFCTPGQILSAIALLNEGIDLDPSLIAEKMSGNLCRCAAYPNIVSAIVSLVRHESI